MTAEDRSLSLREARRLARDNADRVQARRAAPEPRNAATETTAGDLCGRDLNRRIELTYLDTTGVRELTISGTLARIRADSVGMVLNILGDPDWSAAQGVEVELDHKVTIGGGR